MSGQQTTGKIAALKQFGRAYELMVRERYPARDGDRIPVIDISTPLKGPPRKLATEFARFLGLTPVRRGYNTTDIADAGRHREGSLTALWRFGRAAALAAAVPARLEALATCHAVYVGKAVNRDHSTFEDLGSKRLGVFPG